MVSCALFLTTLAVSAIGQARADTIAGDIAYSAGDYAVARREWASAAAQGDPSAMAAMGTLYDVGLGVQQDFALALQWYRRSAEAGNVRGMFNTGAMYDNGRGTAVDRAEALRWYRRAAEHGHGRAGYAAGLIYRDGDGVPRDRAAAIRYFKIAASDGIEAARKTLTAMDAAVPPVIPAVASAPAHPSRSVAADQPGTARLQKALLSRAPLDRETEHRFAELAPSLARQPVREDAIVQYEVGYAFESGHGVRRDPVRSYVFYLRASTSAQPAIKDAALQGAASVAKTLTTDQLAAARDMLLSNTP